MRSTFARRVLLVAACSTALATGACTSSGSSGPAAPAPTTSALTTSATTTSAPNTPAPTASAVAAVIPAGAHAVPAAAYEFGTDDYHGTAHAMPGVVQFTTPSGNIACTYSTGAAPSVYCSITAHDFDLPARPASCTLNWAGGLVTLDSRAATLGLCVGGETVTAHSRTLAYGDVLTSRGVTCYSGRDALTCTDAGHGFRLNRTAEHTF